MAGSASDSCTARACARARGALPSRLERESCAVGLRGRAADGVWDGCGWWDLKGGGTGGGAGGYGDGGARGCFWDSSNVHVSTDINAHTGPGMDLPAGTATATVTTTVTAGVGEGMDGDGESGGEGAGMEISRPRMAITVERDHVREVVEVGIMGAVGRGEGGAGRAKLLG